MKLSGEELNKLDNFSGNKNLREKGKYLYKCSCADYKRLRFLKLIPKHKGLVLPTRLLKNEIDVIYGYQMPKIPNSINIDQYISNPNPEIDILKMIDQLFKLLKIVHRYLIFGDVRNSNILLSENQAYLCDFDFSVLKTQKVIHNSLAYYNLVFDSNGTFYELSQLSDTIKLLISCLSMYYETSLELLRTNEYISFNEVYELLESINASKHILDYCKSLLNDVHNSKDKASISFREYIPYLTLPSTKEKELIRERIATKKG